jgi:hypothetical protein
LALENRFALLNNGHDAFMMVSGLACGFLIECLGFQLRVEIVLERLVE